MKTPLLTLSFVILCLSHAVAQNFTPAPGSPLANGAVGAAYVGQTINVTVPTTVNVTGQQILDIMPVAVLPFASSVIDANTVYPMTVTSSTFTVQGLPTGLIDNCNGCTILAGNNGDIDFTGTPTSGGTFVIDILSETSGEVSVNNPPVGTTVVPFGGTFQGVAVPTMPDVMNGEGYTMEVSGNPVSIGSVDEEYEFNTYPNPTTSTITLQTETPLSQAWLTDLTGRRLMPLQPNGTQWQADLSPLPSGMYLIDVLTQEGRRGVKKVVRE